MVKKGLICGVFEQDGKGIPVENDFTALLDRARDLNILVAGDLMLDRFVHGSVDRISPESPVPVLAIEREDFMPGGAGNVLINVQALGAKAVVFAVCGDDAAGAQLRALGTQAGADMAGVITDPSRPTTQKTRYVARGQQLLRSDVEKTHALNAAIEEKLLAGITAALPRVKAVVLSDYGKGVLSPALIAAIIGAATKAGVPVLVDPKGRDYAKYKGASVVTPNRRELAEACDMPPLKKDAEIETAALDLILRSGVQAVVATRSEDGLSVIEPGKPVRHFPVHVREVFDVSGAGDTVIATIAVALAAGAVLADAARLANIAGGIAVGKAGTTPVTADELRGGAADVPETALLDAAAALQQIRGWQAAGLKVGFTNGCFDIVHAGHVRYLAQARRLCDRLVVGLNNDSSVRILKGPERPVNDEQARAAVMAALGCVDGVVLFGAAKAGEDNTPAALIANLRPDIFFKGGDYTEDQLPEAPIVRAYGGEVCLMDMHEGFSTTSIIARTRKTA